MLKNIVTFSLIVFISVIIIILGGTVLFGQSKLSANNAQSPSLTQTNSSGATLTASAVASHNTASDCWVIVNNNVYDLTNFLGMHSGGAGQIMPFCGKDGTTAFNTKDGRGSHRQGDLSILNSYLVGSINSTTSQQASQGATQTHPTGPNFSRRNDD